MDEGHFLEATLPHAHNSFGQSEWIQRERRTSGCFHGRVTAMIADLRSEPSRLLLQLFPRVN